MSEENTNVEDTEQQEQNHESTGEVDAKIFTQDEVNKIVEKRLQRERQKFASVLNPADPREVSLAERERAVTEKELRIDAEQTFSKEKLPTEALKLLNYNDKESCEQSIELVRNVFKANVLKEVEDRLRGGAPPKAAPNGSNVDESLASIFGLKTQ